MHLAFPPSTLIRIIQTQTGREHEPPLPGSNDKNHSNEPTLMADDLNGTTVTPKFAHLAGVGAPLSGDSMLTCLQNSGFRPSGGRALSTVSSRVAACVQPTKRLAPTILPEGLGPASHLAVALQTEHPFSRPPQMDPHVESAITQQPGPDALQSFQC